MTIECEPARADNSNGVSKKKRRALIVSFYFPPYQAIGAIRVGKLARFLIEQGWEIRVLSATDSASHGLRLEISDDLVVRTDWIDIDKLFSRRTILSKFGLTASVSPSRAATTAQDWDHGLSGRFRQRLHKLFFAMLHWPDRHMGWLPYALEAGNRLFETWRPDLIFASSPPPTALLAADILARRHSLPWIAEFRDPWVDNPYYEHPRWRYHLEKLWEERLIRRSAGIVTVSPVVCDHFSKKFKKPCVVAMNGFDPSDYPDVSYLPKMDCKQLRIVFTGHIYRGYSDPTILFEAIRNLGEEGHQIKVEFYGTCCKTMLPLAEKIGVAESVTVNPPVSHRESLKTQMGADVLLSLQWINEREVSRIAAKIFEYIGARRPILAIGYTKGPVADLLRSRNAGVVCDNSADVMRHLRYWLAHKRDGGIPGLPISATAGLMRAEQFSKVEELMQETVRVREANHAETQSIRYAGSKPRWKRGAEEF